ncbi:hypothetical protein KIW84_051449 [Lathyrus oleraceus]|uniref:Uncharacterized protein n=1 Tax=Pisum sativum TaxID=3888 RepID=A0A9D5AFY9_PEA|nr:hypothetical protein KIW84_051449 [Pisum sativum]
MPLIDLPSTKVSNHSSSLMANVVQNKPKWKRSGFSRGTNRVFRHCGRTNYTIETCFIKNGYPPGFKNKARAFQSSPADNSTSNNDSTSAGTSSVKSFGFTQEQYHSLFGLLQQSQSNPHPTTNSISCTPLALTSTTSPSDDPPQPQPPLDLDIELIILETDPSLNSPPESPKSLIPPSTTIDMTPTSPFPTSGHHNDINIMQPTSDFPINSPSPSLPIRKYIRVTKSPSYLMDFHYNFVLHNNHDAHTHTAYHLSYVLSYEHYTPLYHAF